MGLVFAIISALATAASTYMQAEAARKQKEYQAKIERNNAIAKRQQAELTLKRTEIAQRVKDVEKKELRRGYLAAAGTNRSLLASGNVDITQGSALDLLEGNYNRYADDAGELEYQKEIVGWEGRREAQVQGWEGDVMDSNASFLEQTAGSTGTSLLSAGLAGAGSFASSYSSNGSSWGSSSKTTTSKASTPKASRITNLGGR